MIPKGNQRGGGQGLATHLMNAFDNEQVEIAEVRGSIAGDLHGAFAEWRAQAKSTGCEKYLYSLSVNPDHRQGPFQREQYLDFLDRTEKKMGLAGQPRVVVFHTKEGREHAHCVWSRIDTDKMKAVQMSHDRQKLRTVAQDFARDHNITLPEGMRLDRGKERFEDKKRGTNLAENQQRERTGETKQQRQQAITKAWRESDNAQSFAGALRESGYHLARGDKRSFVIIDRYGEVHSLSRQIEGIKSRDLEARLRLTADQLPDITAAKEAAREVVRQHGLQQQAETERGEQRKAIDERRARMLAAQEKRREELGELHKTIGRSHAEEKQSLADMHRGDNDRLAAFRVASQRKGIAAFLARVTGIQARTERKHLQEDSERQSRQKGEIEALSRRHGREQEELQRRAAALERIAQRERTAFETRLKRDEYQRLAIQDRIYKIDPVREKAVTSRTPMARKFAAAGERHEPHRPEGKEKEDMRVGIRGLFARVADRFQRPQEKERSKAPQEQKASLTKNFEEAKQRHEAHRPEGKEREDLRTGLRADFTAEAAPAALETGKTKDGDTGRGDALLKDFADRAAVKNAKNDKSLDFER